MISLTTLGSPYSQDFDTLAFTGTSSTLPSGWLLAESGTNANATYTAGTGSGNTGDSYSFGAAASSERALGGLLSGSLTPLFGASFSNDTGATLTSLLISYTGEQWRLGTASRVDRLDFQYSVDATSLVSGSWQDANTLDFTAPVTTGTTGARVGNDAANSSSVSSTLSALSVLPGGTIWIRWTDLNASGADDGLAIDNFSLTPQGSASTTPSVNLSLSRSDGSEAAGTVVTVTATASAAVSGNQTLSLAVAGVGITATDYALSNTQITIANGQTSGSVTFTVLDDNDAEPTETAQLSISNPSAGIVLGGTTSQTVSITDNDVGFLTRIAGASSANGAEIPAFDAGRDKLFVVAGTVVESYNMAASGALAAAANLAPGFTPAAGFVAVPNSVATKSGIVAVAWAVVNSISNAQGVGHVTLYSAASGAVLKDLEVGYLPDMLTFTPNGSKIVVANEGEPNSYGQANSFDPVGSISIIDLSNGAATATVQEASFAAFDSQAASLRSQGVRIIGPNATVSQDLEPEYVTVMPDGLTAVVTLQENNAAAVVKLATATVEAVVPLGRKDFNAAGNGIDASDQDGAIKIQNWAVQGMVQPDAIANFSIGGQTYFITANEGDSRNYTGFNEEVRVGAAGYVLDPTIFPNAATLKVNANLGRLQVSNASGDTDGDGDFDQIMAFGGRSFTVWDPVGTPIFDSGDQFEKITAAGTPTLFNSDGTAASFDTRSDNKGPEPEGVVTGVIGGRTYAFLGLERTGDVMVFDVSVPAAPVFVQYINVAEDIGTEGLAFVAAADSPTGKPLLITANEVSRTISIFQIQVPVRIADIQGAAHLSPLNGQGVQNIEGFVTAIASNGFYVQDPLPDNNPATSDGIFVFTGTASALLTARSVGEAVKVSGTVQEFRPGNNVDSLTITELVNNAAVQSLTVVPWANAPAIPIAAVVLGVDRVVPTQAINNDFVAAGNVETGGDFDPSSEGIDFWESLEGMWVRVNAPVAVSPTLVSGSSEELYVLANDGAGATGRTTRGGIAVAADDFNPERLQIDDLDNSLLIPSVDVGAKLSDVIGVIDYNSNNYELRITNSPSVLQASPLAREVTTLAGGTNLLRVATFNVENLDPSDGVTKFNALASAIVTNLKSPDIINLEEVQDNNGATNNGVVDASQTMQALVDAIAAAGGPAYQWRQLDPVNNQDGGEPGGNIRVVFLFDPARVGFVESSLQRLTDTDLSNGDAFANSRKPLVGNFTFNGETITLVGNHFNSKGGDDPLYGPTQPPVLNTEAQREQQAQIVKSFVQGQQTSDPAAKILVLGDLNDFEFSKPLTTLESVGLTSLIETLPLAERYTYNFQGNAQALDHIQANANLLAALRGYDVVHINSEFQIQVSDHDPVLAQFLIEPTGQVINGTRNRDNLVGSPGADTLTGGPGRDVLTGGASGDRFVYTTLLDAVDLITDFTPGSDRLVISTLLSSVGYAGSNPVGDGYLLVSAAAGRTTVLFDADGIAGSGAPRPLVELAGVVVIDPALLLDPTLGS